MHLDNRAAKTCVINSKHLSIAIITESIFNEL